MGLGKLLGYYKAYKAIERWMAMPNFKSVLINAFKHLGLSILSVAGAAIIGYMSNDTGLLKLLTDSGIPGFVAIALVPLLHSVFVILQKKYLPGVADASTTVNP